MAIRSHHHVPKASSTAWKSRAAKIQDSKTYAELKQVAHTYFHCKTQKWRPGRIVEIK
jgi:hypothetical protein